MQGSLEKTAMPLAHFTKKWCVCAALALAFRFSTLARNGGDLGQVAQRQVVNFRMGLAMKLAQIDGASEKRSTVCCIIRVGEHVNILIRLTITTSPMRAFLLIIEHSIAQGGTSSDRTQSSFE